MISGPHKELKFSDLFRDGGAGGLGGDGERVEFCDSLREYLPVFFFGGFSDRLYLVHCLDARAHQGHGTSDCPRTRRSYEQIIFVQTELSEGKTTETITVNEASGDVLELVTAVNQLVNRLAASPPGA